MDVFERVREMYMTAQRNSATHEKGAQLLKAMSLDENIDFNEFLLSLKKCIHATLEVDYKITHQFADKTVAFIAAFCFVSQDHHIKHVDSETDSKTVTMLVNFLIEMSNMESSSHRFRACQFITKIFTGLIGYDLTIEFCNSVQDCLLALIEDKLAKIRMQAAEALAILQDPQNNHCPVVAAYIHHMAYDSSAGVRKICASKIALNRETVPHLIETSLDIDLLVKLAVYKRASKYPNKFKIIHKQQLIISGKLGEGELKKFINSVLVPSWLQHYNMDYLKLLSVLRLDSTWEELENTTAVCEYVIGCLFEMCSTNDLLNVLKLDDKKLLPFDSLNYDSALYWRMFMQRLRKTDGDNLEQFAAQLPDFCDYIESFCKHNQAKIESSEESSNANLEYNFILQQLFYIALDHNYVDITSRAKLVNLIAKVLKCYVIDFEVVNVIILNLNQVLPDINKQTKLMVDITGELLYDHESAVDDGDVNNETHHSAVVLKQMNTTQDDYAIAAIKIKCIQLEADLDEAVKKQDFLKASEIKPQLDDVRKQLSLLQTGSPDQVQDTLEEEVEETEDSEKERREKLHDPLMMMRVLTIMAGYLTSSKIKVLDSMMQTFKMNVIDEGIKSGCLPVKIIAMRCLALCCTLDEHTAKVAIPICCAIIMAHNRSDNNPMPSELVINCIGAVIDSLIRFGTKMVANSNKQNLVDSMLEHEVFTGGTSLTAIISEILEMLNDENVKIQELAGRGICNLILTSRIYSHAVISRLIVKYVSPTSDEMESIKLQQYIGVTLGKLPSVPNAAPQFQKAIIPSIKIILDAPSNSPLANVDIDHIAKLLFEISSQFENGLEIHRNLAHTFIKEIRDKPNHLNNKVYTKILLLLKFSGENKEDLNEICTMLDDLRDRLRDPKLIANIIKLNTKITLTINNNEASVEGNKEGEENAENDSSDSD